MNLTKRTHKRGVRTTLVFSSLYESVASKDDSNLVALLITGETDTYKLEMTRAEAKRIGEGLLRYARED